MQEIPLDFAQVLQAAAAAIRYAAKRRFWLTGRPVAKTGKQKSGKEQAAPHHKRSLPDILRGQ